MERWEEWLKALRLNSSEDAFNIPSSAEGLQEFVGGAISRALALLPPESAAAVAVHHSSAGSQWCDDKANASYFVPRCEWTHDGRMWNLQFSESGKGRYVQTEWHGKTLPGSVGEEDGPLRARVWQRNSVRAWRPETCEVVASVRNVDAHQPLARALERCLAHDADTVADETVLPRDKHAATLASGDGDDGDVTRCGGASVVSLELVRRIFVSEAPYVRVHASLPDEGGHVVVDRRLPVKDGLAEAEVPPGGDTLFAFVLICQDGAPDPLAELVHVLSVPWAFQGFDYDEFDELCDERAWVALRVMGSDASADSDAGEGDAADEDAEAGGGEGVEEEALEAAPPLRLLNSYNSINLADRRWPLVNPSTCCAHCGATGKTLSACAGCKQRRYCSRECQCAHWKTGADAHKFECKEYKAMIARADEDPGDGRLDSAQVGMLASLLAKFNGDPENTRLAADLAKSFVDEAKSPTAKVRLAREYIAAGHAAVVREVVAVLRDVLKGGSTAWIDQVLKEF